MTTMSEEALAVGSKVWISDGFDGYTRETIRDVSERDGRTVYQVHGSIRYYSRESLHVKKPKSRP